MQGGSRRAREEKVFCRVKGCLDKKGNVVCNKVFRSQHALKCHEVVHSKERPFKCSVVKGPTSFEVVFRTGVGNTSSASSRLIGDNDLSGLIGDTLLGNSAAKFDLLLLEFEAPVQMALTFA